MAEARKLTQPGAVPAARRHQETRSPEGRDSAARSQTGDSTLAAMSDAVRRLASAADGPQTVAAATEAVWWITTADAAMNRQHPGAYSRALAALDPAARRAVEGSLAGLRFIRGQLGYYADPADFIQEQPDPSGTRSRPAAWTWSALSPPAPQRGTAREASPYREYRAQLADHPVADTLRRAAEFLSQAHAASRARHPPDSVPAR
jgi:hypothetical protein